MLQPGKKQIFCHPTRFRCFINRTVQSSIALALRQPHPRKYKHWWDKYTGCTHSTTHSYILPSFQTCCRSNLFLAYWTNYSRRFLYSSTLKIMFFLNSKKIIIEALNFILIEPHNSIQRSRFWSPETKFCMSLQKTTYPVVSCKFSCAVEIVRNLISFCIFICYYVLVRFLLLHKRTLTNVEDAHIVLSPVL
mgnify:CR=1 FL=1